MDEGDGNGEGEGGGDGEVEEVRWEREELKCDAMSSAKEGVFPAFEGERMSSGGGRRLGGRERRELVVEGPMEKKGMEVQEEKWEEGEEAERGGRREEER